MKRMQGIGTSVAIAVVVMCCVMAGTLDGVADELDAKAMASAARGLDWLKTVQKDNGAWSNENYPAMTALGLWAFARSDHPDKDAICSRAANFIAQFAQEDGGIYKPATGGRGSGGLSVYNTAICMIALHAYDKTTFADMLLDAREFMAGSQIMGASDSAGGFGYDNRKPTGLRKFLSRFSKRPRADLSNTGWAVHAMRVTQDLEDQRSGEATVDIDWDAARAFALRLQNTDESDAVNHGGFGYDATGSRGGTFVSEDDGTVRLSSFGSMTYAGLESMIYANMDRSDPRVQSALAWAARYWSVEQNPGMGKKGLYYYLNVMSKALSIAEADELKTPDGESITWKKDLVERLAATQEPDGSWINEDNQFWEGDAMLVTAYAVIALQYAGN